MVRGTDGRGRRIARGAPWAVATAVVLAPALAMRFTDALRWDAADFVAAAALSFGACAVLELAARSGRGGAWRAAVGVAVATAVALAWITLAVGLVGAEDHPANRGVAGVLAVAAIGALLSRGRAPALARTMGATALAQGLLGAVAIVAGPSAGPMRTTQVAVLTAGFAASWLLSAALFRRAGRTRAAAPGATL